MNLRADTYDQWQLLWDEVLESLQDEIKVYLLLSYELTVTISRLLTVPYRTTQHGNNGLQSEDSWFTVQ